jgi:hypothetical protein
MSNYNIGVQIDYETVDRITVAGLKDYLDSLEKQLEKHAEGSWMHAEDVDHSHKMIEALKFVLKDFGENHA